MFDLSLTKVIFHIMESESPSEIVLRAAEKTSTFH